MSVVIMVRSGKELFLFGDKKSTHINNFDREKKLMKNNLFRMILEKYIKSKTILLLEW